MEMAEERIGNYNDGLLVSDKLVRTYAQTHRGLVLAPWAARSKAHGYLIAKRVFDIVSSACLLAVIWPVFAIIALAIKLDSEGPVFYKHKRVGQDGKELYLYKFRSMVTNADAMIARFTDAEQKEWRENYKLTHDPRITRVGRFLRKTSLDELPQVFNILEGSLSVVGPRPVIGEELEKYGENKPKFLSAKPGLTGYWQASARSCCSYEQRMNMELYYVERANFLWDLRIIWQTVLPVIQGKGAV
jgi:lipopolysaccharide/colanic/teichoic acid biosynthesis glycosyltransferase